MLLASIAISMGTGALSGFLTRQGVERYELLQKPPLTPPPITFPVVWTLLFFLMGVSAWIIWKIGFKSKQEGENSQSPRLLVSSALQLYAGQLLVNFLWPILFFNIELRLFSFFWLLLLLFMVSVMIWKFYAIGRKSRKRNLNAYSNTLKTVPLGIWAAILQLPYLFWLMFAAYLNFGVWYLNR